MPQEIRDEKIRVLGDSSDVIRGLKCKWETGTTNNNCNGVVYNSHENHTHEAPREFLRLGRKPLEAPHPAPLRADNPVAVVRLVAQSQLSNHLLASSQHQCPPGMQIEIAP